jgi:protein-disulfide isomerase
MAFPRIPLLRATLLLLAALALPATANAAAPPRANWMALSVVTPEGGHRLGNPDAAIKLVEWVSYTCPHCATFQKAADTPLRMSYVNSG